MTQGANQPLSIIVVGAGFGGLVTAIECQNNGMEVTLIERYTDTKNNGDIIDFFPNGGAIMSRWDNGRVSRKLINEGVHRCEFFEFYSKSGRFLKTDPYYRKPEHFYKQFSGHRGKVQNTIFEYAQSIGVKCMIGKTVTKYNDDPSKPSVTLKEGEILKADVIVAADGPKSIALSQLFGVNPNTKINSGFGVFRAHLNGSKKLLENPTLKSLIKKDEDICKFWYGNEGVSAFATSWDGGNEVCWLVTHKDEGEVADKWSFKVSKEEVLQCLEGFDPVLLELIRSTPDNAITDYKLPWRETLKNWISKNGKIIVIGDAAHCNLPYSGQGGSQAIEDGVVLGECLRRSPDDASLALQAAFRIRYNRAKEIHKAGLAILDESSRVNWDTQDLDDTDYKRQNQDEAFSTWILDHNVLDDVASYYDKIVSDIKSNRKAPLEKLCAPTTTGKFNELNLEDISFKAS